METKMRIKLYDEKEALSSDRLVEQATEFRVGPKINHKGGIGLEVYLRNQEDIDSVVKYLKQLKGDLPIDLSKKSPTKTAKKLENMLSEKEPLQDLLKTTLSKCKTQEKLFEFLHEYGFTYLTSDILEHVDKEMFNLKEKHAKYQFLVRLVKQAKDPKNDKYDFRLAFGMKIIGKKVDLVKVYLWGKFHKSCDIPWANKEDINFKKVVKLLIFPQFMDYDERKRWRAEHRKWENNVTKNPDYVPSQFYTKRKPYIKGL